LLFYAKHLFSALWCIFPGGVITWGRVCISANYCRKFSTRTAKNTTESWMELYVLLCWYYKSICHYKISSWRAKMENRRK
jgi:hypothetical protein